MDKRKISYQKYYNKVLGSWIGKSLGGTIGAPFESHKIKGEKCEITTENCWPDEIFPNDDLDIQVVWLEMLEEKGANFTRKDLVDFWQDRCWYNFAEYGHFLYNVQRGIYPPLSGEFNNIYYSESMGCPIRAEIWGLISPGNPELAAEYARMDGELDHIRNSVHAEQFWAACDAEAFFTDDLEKVISAGSKVVPETSDIFRISQEVKQLNKEYQDWNYIWKILIRRYGHRDASKVEINFAFTLLALYRGDCNFKQTIINTLNYGWDVDCTAATAGALLGIMQGADALPEDWKDKLGDSLTCDVDVDHKTALLTDFTTDTCKVGLEVADVRNSLIKVDEVPSEINEEVEQNKKQHTKEEIIKIETIYPESPVLYSNEATPVFLNLTYTGNKEVSGELNLITGEDVIISPQTLTLNLTPGDFQQFKFNIKRNNSKKILWDKNLIKVEWKLNSGETGVHLFGLAGSKQWQVYGPYWDAWDKEKSEVCPYRNDELISHPVHVPGCGVLNSHQYVTLDREYLDESKLIGKNIPAELPFKVERGEDHLDSEHLGGFTGEACYYLVREIAAEEPVTCNVSFGATGPFKVWLDGEEVLKIDKDSAWKSWATRDYSFEARFDKVPRRMVIKCIRPGDYFRFSLCFIKKDVRGDKTEGISYLIDKMGDVI